MHNVKMMIAKIHKDNNTLVVNVQDVETEIYLSMQAAD